MYFPSSARRTFIHLMSSQLCNRCTAGGKAHANFVNESACLMVDNIQNELVTIHRSQDVLKMLSYLHVDIFLQLFH
jgi:hypothetical protein